jgi:elongation factor P--(R)-beta-lysine ligase
MRLRYQFELIQLIRNFFGQQGFLDVMTPPAVENPGMEVHIHPFQVHSVVKNKLIPSYLHTSPEFALKDLLSRPEENLDKLFSISYCFRDEPDSPIHRSQFLMLEWYRKHVRYESIMEDTESLINFCLNSKLPIKKELMGQTIVKKTMQQLFQEILNVDILQYLDVPSLKNLLKQFPDVPLPTAECEWDDYFFLLYLNKIEPEISRIPMLMVYEFPAPLSALSTLKSSDPRVCERFEVYIYGIELCNCFNELTDVKEQKKRFLAQNELKQKIYHYQLPEPKKFYAAMERGLPPSAGIALGVERLFLALCDIDNPFYY